MTRLFERTKFNAASLSQVAEIDPAEDSSPLTEPRLSRIMYYSSTGDHSNPVVGNSNAVAKRPIIMRLFSTFASISSVDRRKKSRINCIGSSETNYSFPQAYFNFETVWMKLNHALNIAV